MQLKRVVITGYGAISPYGRGITPMMEGLYRGTSAVRQVEELGQVQGMRPRVAGLVSGVDPKVIPRKHRRSMSAMSIFATLACQEALQQAGVNPDNEQGNLGICFGSTVGSTQATEAFFKDYFSDHSLERMKSTVFFQIMNHSCAANVAQTLDITGRIMAPSAACSTGCQAVGYGYEQVALGKQTMLLCGGADEFHPLTAATFDVMHAASTAFNECPHATPRPFDLKRDGMVCAEGAGALLIESLESAEARGATIIAEISGFATVSDPSNIANPNSAAMERCMRETLKDAQLAPEEISYVNAHATATAQGDIAESEAIYNIFGSETPVSSLKGHMGHTMAASGALELIASLEMLRRGELVPTLNLEEVDPACSPLQFLRSVTPRQVKAIMKNNFALGGVNSSLVVRSIS
ncbi:MAG: beta-ketoacyl-[acyl-carrier-protein] synthase family protein [Desulfuromonas sp.]|nr:MAG: beta-ketoacyl-[acyl-carrier-protein] synthase family protein [Desulfuromonas sp.]